MVIVPALVLRMWVVSGLVDLVVRVMLMRVQVDMEARIVVALYVLMKTAEMVTVVPLQEALTFTQVAVAVVQVTP